jgi:two-component system, sensor histidine kinase YesM
MRFLLFLLILPIWCLGQGVEPAPSAYPSKKEESYSKIKKGASRLKKAVDENDEASIAGAYEQLAEDYAKKGDLVKAEEYYTKAQTIYQKLNDVKRVASTSRALAKIQENLNKPNSALQNYESAKQAAETKSDVSSTRLNENDVRRIQNTGKPEKQAELLRSNVGLIEKSGDSTELAESYARLGDLNAQQNRAEDAIQNYRQAAATTSEPAQQVSYTNKIADLYVTSGQMEQAIAEQKNLLATDAIKQDPGLQIAQIQRLATIYSKATKPDSALMLLHEGYRIALAERRTLDAKNGLEKLTELYVQRGDLQSGIALNRAFLQQLDSLVQSDITLVNAKMLSETEERIEQLELEKALKDQLLAKQNRFNRYLLFSSALLLLLLLLIGRAWMAIREKNKKIALQSLRREMNPHFVFNSLNSINQFIAQHNELEANKYLTAYSSLMRNIMENSNKDFIPLSRELDTLQRYLALEKMRFPDTFDYRIEVSEGIDADTQKIPNMILQPHLENAIWHGLRYRNGQGWLTVRIEQTGGQLHIHIEDNGIGLTQSETMKTSHQKAFKSRGLDNTRERIALINQIYHKNISFTITEKTAPESGVIVSVYC